MTREAFDTVGNRISWRTAADAAASAWQLARHGWALAADRAPWHTGSVPAAAGDIDAAWLCDVLAAVEPGVVVASVEDLGGHSGTTARSRIRVRYAEGADRDLPEVFFVKLAPRHVPTALFGSVMALGANEVRFYRYLAGEVPVRVPRSYCAVTGSTGQRFALLLEDLAASGCRFRGVGDPCEAEAARDVVAAMATLHASYWESARLDGDLAWLARRGQEPAYPVARILCELAVGPALKRFGDVVPARLRRDAGRINELRDVLEDAWGAGPRTVIHGDPHIGNLYFTREGEPGFLDWQIVGCGQGLRDVAHFVVSSLSIEDRREWEASLLRHYVETLESCGVVGFSLDRARDLYRLHTLYEWFAATVTAAAGTLQPTGVSRAAMERASAAILDWDAIDALDALA